MNSFNCRRRTVNAPPRTCPRNHDSSRIYARVQAKNGRRYTFYACLDCDLVNKAKRAGKEVPQIKPSQCCGHPASAHDKTDGYRCYHGGCECEDFRA